jgi:hypothetical protein
VAIEDPCPSIFTGPTVNHFRSIFEYFTIARPKHEEIQCSLSRDLFKTFSAQLPPY